VTRAAIPGLIAPALARLDAVYGEVLADPAAARDALAAAFPAMLAAFPEGGMATVTAKGPRETLEKNLALFRRVDRATRRFWTGTGASGSPCAAFSPRTAAQDARGL
jgi:hypothetical protein